MSTATEKKPRLTTSAMIASIAGEGQRVKAAPFGKALVTLAERRTEIVGLTADLAKYTDLHLFAQAYPDRFYQMGMAEQLLMATAGGIVRPRARVILSPCHLLRWKAGCGTNFAMRNCCARR